MKFLLIFLTAAGLAVGCESAVELNNQAITLLAGDCRITGIQLEIRGLRSTAMQPGPLAAGRQVVASGGPEKTTVLVFSPTLEIFASGLLLQFNDAEDAVSLNIDKVIATDPDGKAVAVRAPARKAPKKPTAPKPKLCSADLNNDGAVTVADLQLAVVMAATKQGPQCGTVSDPVGAREIQDVRESIHAARKSQEVLK